MNKMEVITLSGKKTPVASGLNRIKITQPGSTVKISASKEMIVGSQKQIDDLILTQKDGSTITIEDFFKKAGSVKNKLVLEDGGKFYEAKYNTENFTGLTFAPTKPLGNENTDAGEIDTLVWLVPLIGLAAVGVGIAVYNDNDDGDSHSKNSSAKEKQALSDSQKAVPLKESALASAQKQLADAIKAMQANPSAATIKAVDEASTAVNTALQELNKANTELKSAIDAAKAKGIDTSSAEQTYKNAAANGANAINAINNAADLVKTATGLITDSAKVVVDQAATEYKSASEAVIAANKQPTKSTIDTAKAQLAKADDTLTQLKQQIDLLSQQIIKGQQQGFNVSQANARLKDLQDQYAKFSQQSKTLADAIQQAEKNAPDDTPENKTLDAIKQALSDAQKAAELKDSALISAQKKLADAIKAMMDNPSPSTIKAVEDASAAVKNDQLELSKINAVLKSAIDAAKAKGIDTTAAEQTYKQVESDQTSAGSAIDNAAELVKTAVTLVNNSTKVLADQVEQEYKSVSEAVAAANKLPAKDTIEAAQNLLATADKSLATLKEQIDQLEKQIVKGQQQGFNVTQANDRLKDLQEQYTKLAKQSELLASNVKQAEQSLQDLNEARKSVDAANEVVKQALEQKKLAEEKRASVLELKANVLKNNQLDRVDEVNKLIVEANKSLENARQAADAANSAAMKANADIDKINSQVDPSLLPKKIDPVDVSNLQPIDKGLQVNDNKSFIESIQSFVKKLVDSVTQTWDKFLKIIPINTIISDITSGFKTVGDLIGQKISAVVESFKIVGKALGDFFVNKPISFVSDLISITWQKFTQAVNDTFSTFKSGFDAVVSGLGKAISDAVSQFNLFKPSTWFTAIKDVIVNSISNVVKGIYDTVVAIPGKIIGFITDGISKYVGAFTKMIGDKFDVVKNAISDVVKTLFDGFIKNPIDKLIKPVLDKIGEFLSNPMESVQKLISSIVDIAKNAIDLIKNVIGLPGQWINATKELFKDIVNSFKKDSVKNGDGSELQKLAQKFLNDKQPDTLKELNSLLKSGAMNGDINLNKLVPESATNKASILVDNHSSPSVTNYHSQSAMDDMHSSLPVAA